MWRYPDGKGPRFVFTKLLANYIITLIRLLGLIPFLSVIEIRACIWIVTESCIELNICTIEIWIYKVEGLYYMYSKNKDLICALLCMLKQDFLMTYCKFQVLVIVKSPFYFISNLSEISSILPSSIQPGLCLTRSETRTLILLMMRLILCISARFLHFFACRFSHDLLKLSSSSNILEAKSNFTFFSSEFFYSHSDFK